MHNYKIKLAFTLDVAHTGQSDVSVDTHLLRTYFAVAIDSKLV